MKGRAGPGIGIALLALVATGCASGAPPNPADPWQRVNRPVFAFNEGVDRWVLGPVADGWTFVTWDGLRDSVAKFFYNARFPSRFVSNLGQGDATQAGIEATRFLINTTVGVAGFFDPATGWGLARRDEDAGQMFGVWGIPPGPYLVLPLLGPSNPRDTVGLAFDAALSPFTWLGFLVGFGTFGVPGLVDVVNSRARADERIESARRAALDYYVFVRDAFTQYREAAIENRGSLSDYGSGAIYESGPGDDLYEVPDAPEGEPDDAMDGTPPTQP